MLIHGLISEIVRLEKLIDDLIADKEAAVMNAEYIKACLYRDAVEDLCARIDALKFWDCAL